MQTKVCSKCDRSLPTTEFYSHAGHTDGLRSECKDCTREINRERYHNINKANPAYLARRKEYANHWYSNNFEEICAKRRKLDRAIREECLRHYGGKCACCGETRFEFLAIDHINGGGRQHRLEVGSKIHRWLVKNDFPEGFRVLCHNCNAAIGYYGYCPHEKERQS